MHNINIIFLVETWEHEAKPKTNIHGYIIKPKWPHIRSNIGRANVEACIFHEGLEMTYEYISIYVFNEYKMYMWVGVTLCKEVVTFLIDNPTTIICLNYIVMICFLCLC